MKQTVNEEYGLIGYPLKHSFSQRFFTEKFKNEDIDAVYSNFEIENVNDIISILNGNENIKGFNVTIPHKQAIIPLLKSLSDEAREIGAVNVVKVSHENGEISLKGFNSDVIGFINSIAPLIDAVKQKKALVLGTGGASKAVVYGLRKLGIEPQLVSRNKGVDILSYNELKKDIIEAHPIIVNCTPLGTFPEINEHPPIPYCYLNNNHILYDLVYNPAETSFLRKAQEQGAITKNGAEMLELQALAAWNIWNKQE